MIRPARHGSPELRGLLRDRRATTPGDCTLGIRSAPESSGIFHRSAARCFAAGCTSNPERRTGGSGGWERESSVRMSSVWERYGAVVSVTVLLGLPLGALVILWLVRRRTRRGWSPSWAWRATVAEVFLVVGTAPWLWMIMTPTSGPRGLQLIPLHDLQAVLTGEDSVVQVVGNLLAFAALGFLLPIRFRLADAMWVPGVVALVVTSLSLLFEVLQFTMRLGRVASIDDILLNTVGAVLAALASARWWRSRAPRGSSGRAV